MQLSLRSFPGALGCALSTMLAACSQGSDTLSPDPEVPTQPSTLIPSTQLPPSTPSPRCSKQEVTINRLHPTIWLVVDGSGSMNEALSDSDMTSRWNALRAALLDPSTGALPTLEHAADWGLTLYDGPLPDGTGGDAISCPRLVHVAPKADNLSALVKAFPEAPLGGSTPTDRALAALVERLPAPASATDPQLVVLVTDGQPNDFCPTAIPATEIQAKVVEAAAQLSAAGTQVYVVSLAPDDAALQAHLEQVAKAGGSGRPAFAPRTRADLAQTFEAIFGPKPSCEITLSEAIEAGSECRERVQLNGESLRCNDPDGYRFKSLDTFELTGRACDAYQTATSGTVVAELPCSLVP